MIARLLATMLGLLIGLAGIVPLASAHESLPIVITLEEDASGQFGLELRLPGNVDPGQRPELSLASPCTLQASGGIRSLYSCPADTRPAAIEVRWPGGIPPSALLVRSSFQSGEQRSEIAAPGATLLALPRAQSPLEVSASYFRIGLEHILLGLDHLLFLICLVLIAKTPRRMALTVTGFTLGHAVTISLATLGVIRLDSMLVEALIALSIVFVACEVFRGRNDTLIVRRPVVVAAGFGTLHGLGFAGALAEIGLPQTSVPLALLGFNLGVEAGQLLFVLAVVLVMAAARRVEFAREQGLRVSTAAIGVVASLWFWERTFAMFTGA